MPAIKGFYVNGVTYNYQDGNLAPEFESYKRYLVNDLILYDGELYKCKISHISEYKINKSFWEKIKLKDYFTTNYINIIENSPLDFGKKAPISYDFSHVFTDNYFTETLENGQIIRYNIERDENGTIIKITQNINELETLINWPEDSGFSGQYWFGSKANYAELVSNETVRDDVVYFIESENSADTNIIFIEEPELPNEYEKLEYLTFHSPAGILVDIPSDFFGYGVFSITDIPKETETIFFGYRVSSSNNLDFELRIKANSMDYDVWSRSTNNVTYQGGKIIIDNQPIKFYFGYKNLRTSAYIGGYAFYNSNVSAYSFNGRFYNLRGYSAPFLDNTESSLLFNFIPCKLKSDNTLGIYETVNGVFYSTVTGTGYIEEPQL